MERVAHGAVQCDDYLDRTLRGAFPSQKTQKTKFWMANSGHWSRDAPLPRRKDFMKPGQVREGIQCQTAGTTGVQGRLTYSRKPYIEFLGALIVTYPVDPNILYYETNQHPTAKRKNKSLTQSGKCLARHNQQTFFLPYYEVPKVVHS